LTSPSSGTTAAASQEELASESGRRALRRVAAGVTVLTVNNDGLRHGTTVSAVVALSRTPLVLGVCLRASSTFTAMVRKAGVFSVNVLNDQQGHLARQFAAPDRSHGDAQFAGVEWTEDALTGAPLIGGSLAHLACALSGGRARRGAGKRKPAAHLRRASAPRGRPRPRREYPGRPVRPDHQLDME
jgi:flavin reductase (DIM6/NTAB) family NADH-FMN oxidoreductase RutF